VISAGFAGGLQPGLDVGDLVLGQNYSDPGLVAKLKLGPLWKTGNIITEPAIIEKGEGKRLLGEKTGCLVGDMETAHLAAVCAAHGVPMLSVRCISDALDDDMPVPAAILLSPQTGRPDPLALFRYLISHPKSVPGFNRLMKNAKTAQTCLAAGLLEILPQVLRT
jgi:nucleoside phosphorylase